VGDRHLGSVATRPSLEQLLLPAGVQVGQRGQHHPAQSEAKPEEPRPCVSPQHGGFSSERSSWAPWLAKEVPLCLQTAAGLEWESTEPVGLCVVHVVHTMSVKERKEKY